MILFHHRADCLAIGVGDWLLAIGCWRSVVGYWPYWPLAIGYCLAGCGRWIRTIDFAFKERRVTDYSIPQDWLVKSVFVRMRGPNLI
jgi:hypothetical protein